VEDWKHKVESGKSLVKFFEERVGTVRGKTILDVGFGSGGICIAFNLSGAVATGVDIDPELKDIAERNVLAHGAHADFKLYNGSDLPFSSESFDYVISSSVLEHVSFPEKLLGEMLRVVKPHGRILLTLPNKYYPKETHTLAYFVSYMPRFLAGWYLKLLKRSPLEHDNLHFYSYFDIMHMLKKTNSKYELIYKDTSAMSGMKKFLMSALKKCNIHYTAFLKQLMFVIEKK
jgi:ubiquinone/menaquinone biosynthesis C-methylase UbiE